MERTPVQSSNVAEIGYDPMTMTLEVAYRNGSVYQYYDVPQVLYEELLRADSIGRFLNSQIKNNFRYARL
jgi:hypothetical protein